jgi:6,7-dimethyl-8-ribityllumazine synthase
MADAPHIMIVESRYYEEIAEELIQSVMTELNDAGATFERFEVPGAFEIPAAIKFAIRSMNLYPAQRRFDGYIALGCVIRGQTSHYDYVCGESARALQDLAVEYSLALGYGILTVENRDQAMARAKRSEQDRGGHAARACLKMIEHKTHFRLFPR